MPSASTDPLIRRSTCQQVWLLDWFSQGSLPFLVLDRLDDRIFSAEGLSEATEVPLVVAC